jgi:hypothetical protein
MQNNMMYGITHELDGSLIIREPKILKVGIGLPKGPAISAWLSPDKKWNITTGFKEGEKKNSKVDTKAEAEEKFHQLLPSAPECKYPRKIGFFTFSRPSVTREGKEQFIPDFDAIEAHGPNPTEIDIVLLDDAPFAGAYQMWSTSELRCKGDGVSAMRVVTLDAGHKEAAAAAIAAGQKYFPLTGCWTGGCPYAKETKVGSDIKPSLCKPGGDLKFQLACNIRVGGTAYFHTTGYRSISSIFSSLHRVASLTGGRLCGIPLKMVLRPFRTNHNGQAATQYAVSLEFRAPDPATLSKRLMESVFAFRQAAPPVRMIESQESAIEEGEEIISAEAMTAEFYPDEEEQEAPPMVQVKTEEKTAGLAEKMAKNRAVQGKANNGPVVVPEPVASPAPPEPVYVPGLDMAAPPDEPMF